MFSDLATSTNPGTAAKSSQATSAKAESRRNFREEGDCKRKVAHPIDAPVMPRKMSTSHCEKEDVSGSKPSTFSTRRFFKLFSATWCNVRELTSVIRAKSENPSRELLNEQFIF